MHRKRLIYNKNKTLTTTCKRAPTWPPVRGCKQAMCWDMVGDWWAWLISGKCDGGPHWWFWGKWAACWFWWTAWWLFWWIGWNWGWCDIGDMWCLEGVCCWFCRNGNSLAKPDTNTTCCNYITRRFLGKTKELINRRFSSLK